MSTSKVLLYVLGAAAVGAAIGVLFASDKGAELAGRVKTSAEKWLKNGSHKAEDLYQGSDSSHQRAEFDQANFSGIA